MAIAIPTRKQSFTKATNGQHLNVWLCQNHYRADQLFQEQITRYDPFASMHARASYLATFRED